MSYVFDTGAFIDLNSYFPDIFPAFWQNFDRAVATGDIVSTREVLRELKRHDPDHILKWAMANTGIFSIPTADETRFVGQILSVPHFQQIISARARLNGTPVADPFVIASAAVNSGTVVTQERPKPHSAKMPNVCDHFGVRWLDLNGFMRDMGWRF
jgi:hypothetical protein